MKFWSFFIKGLLPFYYQISNSKEYNMNCHSSPKQLVIFDRPYLYYEYNHSVHILSDICPHQGAYLSKGWVNKRGNIHCPYHGFEFDSDGRFMCIPTPELSKKGGRHCPLKKFHTFQNGKDLYLCPIEDTPDIHHFPYYPPEHYDEKFTSTSGSRIINQDYRVVTENVLDMLHISYVHTFGNINQPLPFNIHYHQLSDVAGRTRFEYHPFNYTISMVMGNDTKVVVENEFILPTTTITRVISGDIVKTVLTRSTPISKNKTLFFYTVYRNFWFCRWKWFGWINVFFDMFMNTMMDLTISEDVAILRNVDAKHRVGEIITKYDVTIQQYRTACRKALEKYHHDRKSGLFSIKGPNRAIKKP